MMHIFGLSFRLGRIAEFGCSRERMLLPESLAFHPEVEFHFEMASKFDARSERLWTEFTLPTLSPDRQWIP
jgi:hypothetical protein